MINIISFFIVCYIIFLIYFEGKFKKLFLNYVFSNLIFYNLCSKYKELDYIYFLLYISFYLFLFYIKKIIEFFRC